MAKNTTPALPVWIQDLSVEDIGRQHGSAINVYVHGFWSDVITIYVRREQRYNSSLSHLPYSEHPVEWTFSISHSSGGRDKGDGLDDLEAETNFAMGLMAAVQHARLLRSQTTALEAAYQKRRAEEEAREAARKVEAEAAKAADAALGVDKAAELLRVMAASTDRRTERQLKAWERGSDKHPTVFTSKMGRDGVVRFFKAGVMLSRHKAEQDLATFSARTTLEA
jgi:hypothetical protein